ncbi:protein WALLS ARE THIN 1 [Selaginella moellendorffii]|uniref:protein WALLS ARE THIN 1 n=1 Tax=Selaginella moellendorffii TaxID=88036 RepID=UPI000D1C6612|nr:protein WALLS ARE THIN 1 [Selaginella moellendorffii]|eukprot:XP_024537304.1 protein WALLS ARE THIN 1 [Selaginella moellendorffii]
MLAVHASLVVTQFCFAGFEILARIALVDGVDHLVFTLYRNFLASILLLPLAYFVEKKKRPALNFKFVLLSLCLGTVTINQMCYLIGLQYTNTVIASALRNLIPVLTFVLATILRVDELDVKKLDGVAKILGTLLGLVGAVLLSSHHPTVREILRHQFLRRRGDLELQTSGWELGIGCLLLAFLSFALFLVLQSLLLKKYAAPFSIGAFSCLFSTLQLGIISASFGQASKIWSFWTTSQPRVILSVLYAGLIGSGFVSGVQSWGVHKGGPVLVAAYQPLETVLVTLFYVFFGGQALDPLSMGGILLVFAGLYLLAWAQRHQRQRKLLLDQSIREPLLDNVVIVE